MSTLSHADLLQLKRWNTPTIYNGWEQITSQDIAADAFNLEPTTDFMPQMGPMIGRAVTMVIEPSNPAHKLSYDARAYREYIASIPGPKIVVVQDLNKPNFVGSTWGEVNSNTHRALGCVGTITDGCIRDLDEMTNAGFKALAARLCVGHAHWCTVRWNCEVEVFGRRIQPGPNYSINSTPPPNNLATTPAANSSGTANGNLEKVNNSHFNSIELDLRKSVEKPRIYAYVQTQRMLFDRRFPDWKQPFPFC